MANFPVNASMSLAQRSVFFTANATAMHPKTHSLASPLFALHARGKSLEADWSSADELVLKMQVGVGYWNVALDTVVMAFLGVARSLGKRFPTLEVMTILLEGAPSDSITGPEGRFLNLEIEQVRKLVRAYGVIAPAPELESLREPAQELGELCEKAEPVWRELVAAIDARSEAARAIKLHKREARKLMAQTEGQLDAIFPLQRAQVRAFFLPKAEARSRVEDHEPEEPEEPEVG